MVWYGNEKGVLDTLRAGNWTFRLTDEVAIRIHEEFDNARTFTPTRGRQSARDAESHRSSSVRLSAASLSLWSWALCITVFRSACTCLLTYSLSFLRCRWASFRPAFSRYVCRVARSTDSWSVRPSQQHKKGNSHQHTIQKIPDKSLLQTPTLIEETTVFTTFAAWITNIK